MNAALAADKGEAAKPERAAEPASANASSCGRWGNFFVYAPIRDQLGLRRARWCVTGGAPLGPDTFRFLPRDSAST